MGSVSESRDQVPQKTYWRWSKLDFFPEKSFQNWGTYRDALSQTGLRFKDCLLTRSDETSEVMDLQKQSKNKMKRCLNWWDLTWVNFGAVIGAGIFVLTGQEAHFDAGPAIVVSYLAAGFSTMLGVFIYTEFAVEIPVAGGSFAYLRVKLGDFVAFVAAANILLDYMLANAAVARSWTSYLTTLLNRLSNSLVIHTNLKQ
ncbi:hypothetical protein RHSIM_Rhsim02G0171000 [Rhododendron simsii]|uniref:Uncharacterized protein n=1 Tax=Rhododendron simsii TaxID=118357 RepID=A0A834HF96_RHOSS|nr:hypothetical protein RHSIM_Rhsim02G0171000 [Rhododendron simsii]